MTDTGWEEIVFSSTILPFTAEGPAFAIFFGGEERDPVEHYKPRTEDGVTVKGPPS